MSDNDPRLTPLRVALEDSVRLGRVHYGGAQGVLGAIDHADRAAGIVRVDTNNEALVERLAEVMLRQQVKKGMISADAAPDLAALPDTYRDAWLRESRATLAAIREAAQ